MSHRETQRVRLEESRVHDAHCEICGLLVLKDRKHEASLFHRLAEARRGNAIARAVGKERMRIQAEAAADPARSLDDILFGPSFREHQA
jgi:hypothetical protein